MQADRLFDEEVFASLETGLYLLEVVGVVGCDGYHVYVWILQDIHRLRRQLGDRMFSTDSAEFGLVEVAEGHDLTGRVSLVSVDVLLPHAQTDDPCPKLPHDDTSPYRRARSSR